MTSRTIPSNPDLARWFEKIQRHQSGCWLWQGTTGNQRSQFWLKGHRVAAHRFSYSAFRGAIPKNQKLRPTCGEPLCVNPEHLEITVRTHCRSGHDLTVPENRREYRGYVVCRECQRIGRRRRYATREAR